MSVRLFGSGFDQAPSADISLTADEAEVVIDLAALKISPGEHTIALYGGAVMKYRYAPDAIAAAESARREAEKNVGRVEQELKKLTNVLKSAPPAKRAELDMACKAVEAKRNVVVAELEAASEQVKRAKTAAEPKGIVDIVVSEPIVVHVQAAEAQ